MTDADLGENAEASLIEVWEVVAQMRGATIEGPSVSSRLVAYARLRPSSWSEAVRVALALDAGRDDVRRRSQCPC